MIVERKTWDDLWSSLKTPRFASQVNRMKVSSVVTVQDRMACTQNPFCGNSNTLEVMQHFKAID